MVLKPQSKQVSLIFTLKEITKFSFKQFKDIFNPIGNQVLVQDILAYTKLCNKVIIHHIFREGNCTADWLAKFGHCLYSKVVWIVVPYRDLLSVLYEDNLGRTLERRII